MYRRFAERSVRQGFCIPVARWTGWQNGRGSPRSWSSLRSVIAKENRARAATSSPKSTAQSCPAPSASPRLGGLANVRGGGVQPGRAGVKSAARFGRGVRSRCIAGDLGGGGGTRIAALRPWGRSRCVRDGRCVPVADRAGWVPRGGSRRLLRWDGRRLRGRGEGLRGPVPVGQVVVEGVESGQAGVEGGDGGAAVLADAAFDGGEPVFDVLPALLGRGRGAGVRCVVGRCHGGGVRCGG